MATLKSIKNKYLAVADGEVLGVDQNKDNVSLLAFKLAAADSLAKFDMRDGFFDDYQDAAGVDTSASTDELRNASNYYSGGSIGSYSTSAFTSTGSATWTVPANTSEAEILVVAGGGGGGGEHGGGGGGGGIVHHSAYPLAASGTTYNITVGGGNGRAGQWNVVGTQGSDSVFDSSGTTATLTAKGGGGGGSRGGVNAAAGGSGGGSDGSGSAGSSNQQSSGTSSGGNITSYGNAGGTRGGGGAGGAGGGSGGSGQNFSNFSPYGSSGTFGAGAARTSGSGQNDAADGAANTGNGGEGANRPGFSAYGGSGGSGIVLIRHRPVAYNNMTLISNSTTAQAQPDTADVVLKYTNGIGTATINTDLKAYVSRDNGTTYTQGTLVSEGTTGSDTILAARRVDISGQPAGTSMRYKITTHNQSSSKETRVQSVSLAWA